MKLKPILINSNESNIIHSTSKYGGLFLLEHYGHPMVEMGDSYKDIILIDPEAEIYVNNIVYESDTGYIYKYNQCGISDLDFKVIATTNGKNELPLLSHQAIKLLINYYNEHKCMPDNIEIETEEVRHLKGVVEIITYEPLENLQGTVDIIIPEEKKMIFHKYTKQEGDYLRVYGAGKFQEESLILDKDQAALLLIDLFKFINIKNTSKVEEKLYAEEEIKSMLAKLMNDYTLKLAENEYHEAVNNTKFDLKEWFNQNKKK